MNNGNEGPLETYEARQRAYHRQKIEDKWSCEAHENAICILTEDEQHLTLSPRDTEEWLDGICKGLYSSASPPNHIFENICGGAVWNRHNGGMTVTAMPISPSRKSSSQYSGSGQSSATSSRSSADSGTFYTTPSELSSIMIGPGYYAGVGLIKIGDAVITLWDHTSHVRKANEYISVLTRWKNQGPFTMRDGGRKLILGMLDDALDWSQPRYGQQRQKKAFEIVKHVQELLELITLDPNVPADNILLIQVKVVMLPIMFRRIQSINLKKSDSLAEDLAFALTDGLTKYPIGMGEETLQPSSQRAPTDIAGFALTSVIPALAYSKLPEYLEWLPFEILRIVEWTLPLRPLTAVEEACLLELSHRRLANEESILRSEDIRPWEVALFALCGSNNEAFREPLLRQTGLPSLLTALKRMMRPQVLEDKGWGNVVLTLRSLAFISALAWTTEDDTTGEALVSGLVSLLRDEKHLRNLPVHYWATDTLRNIVSHHKKYLGLLKAHHIQSPLGLVLPGGISPLPSPTPGTVPLPDVDPNAKAVSPKRSIFSLRSLFRRNSQDGLGQTPTHRRRSSSSSMTSTTGAAPRKEHSRLVYLRDARERAEELESWLNDPGLHEHSPLPTVVSIAGPQSWGMLSTFLDMATVEEE